MYMGTYTYCCASCSSITEMWMFFSKIPVKMKKILRKIKRRRKNLKKKSLMELKI
jgi:hypothetical protein